MQKLRGFGVVEIIIVVALVAAAGAGAWYILQPRGNQVATTPPPTNQNQEPAPQPEPTTKKYVNTKYGYSFEYPVDAKIYSDTHYGGQPIPVTEDSGIVIVDVGEKRFEVVSTGYSDLTPEQIRRDFSGTHRSEEISIIDINIGGSAGFLATLNNSTAKYYYLQKIANSPVFSLTASSGLESIVESFKFE